MKPIAGGKGRTNLHLTIDSSHVRVQGSDPIAQLPAKAVPNGIDGSKYMEVYFYQTQKQLGIIILLTMISIVYENDV